MRRSTNAYCSRIFLSILGGNRGALDCTFRSLSPLLTLMKITKTETTLLETSNFSLQILMPVFNSEEFAWESPYDLLVEFK